jgi:hypothetical protein
MSTTARMPTTMKRDGDAKDDGNDNNDDDDETT